MGRKTRPRRLAPHEQLTREQEGELVGNLHALRCMKHDGPVTLSFESMDAKREAWFAHRDRLMERFAGTGTRPAGWWIFEAGEPYAPTRPSSRPNGSKSWASSRTRTGRRSRTKPPGCASTSGGCWGRAGAR